MAKNGLHSPARREMRSATERIRDQFRFLEELGFATTGEHHGDTFDFVWVEYKRDLVVARVSREKTYWEISLRRTDQPRVHFDALEAFPLIGLGDDPTVPLGYQDLEALAATVARVIESLLGLVNEAGMSQIEALRSARARATRKGQS